MKAFISYSLNDQDMYVLTLLSGQLKEKGFSISQSTDFHSLMSSKTILNINKSDLFIGLVTVNSDEEQRVINECKRAVESNKPTIMLVEDGVLVSDSYKYPYISFNRENPNNAIDELQGKIAKKKKIEDNDAWLWVLGGVVLISIIALIAGKSNKK